MASSTKILPFIFLLTTLVCSIQTHARDSQFFSKVTRDREDSTTIPTTTTPNTNKKDDFVPLAKLEKADEQPTFLPQTTETGYGLYGHETGLNPPSTTTTSLYNMDHENTKNNNENFNNYYKQRNNNNQYHHDRNYIPELKGLSMDDATTYTESFPSKGWSYNKNNVEDKFFDENNHQKNENFNNYYMNKNNENDHEVKGLSYNNGQGKFYNAVEAEKQGMSDTRFMENGKYFYDLNADNNNNKYDIPNNNYMSYSNNNYNNNGYYGNKETNYEEMYNNNKNKFYNSGNGMQKYQSQVPDEEEFDFDQP